jgi:CO dehydrogenase/acetyl-CoA synthase delta subunit
VSPRPRRIGEPRPAAVRADAVGTPLVVDGRSVEAVRESWLVEDRWWTDRPLRRRYWEVVTTCGRNVVVFRDLGIGRWYSQR